jgi:hypothetical protein
MAEAFGIKSKKKTKDEDYEFPIILIPTAIRNPVIGWYHQYHCHTGATRTDATIRNTMMWPGFTRNIGSHCKTCKFCQFNKKQENSMVKYM